MEFYTNGESSAHNAPLFYGAGQECKVKYVHIRGTLFFSSTRKFINLFSVTEDPSTVILDFKDALIVDHSAVAAIQGISHRFAQQGKRVLLTNLPGKSHKRLYRTGNHSMLQQQITSPSKLEQINEEDVENAAVAAEPEQTLPASLSGAVEPGVHPGEALERVDEFGVGEKLARLHIFHNPVDPVETEIAWLGRDQGSVSLRSVKKDS